MNINVITKFDPAMLSLAERAIGLLYTVSDKETKIMATLQDIVDVIAAETTAVGTLSAFVQGLRDQIAALPGLTAAQQAHIDGIFVAVDANKAAIMAAMNPVVVTPPPVVV